VPGSYRLLLDEISRQGLTIEKVSSALLEVFSLYLPEGICDPLFLSNYVTINILDVIKRINGVGDAYLFGPLDYSMPVWLDPQKLANLDISAAEIVSVIQRQNVQAAVGRIGAAPVQQFQLSINTKGRPTTGHEFRRIIVRATPDRSVVLVGDVSTVLGNLIVQSNGQPELAGVFSTFAANTPQLYLDIDRDKAQTLGVNINDIFNAVKTTLGGYYVNNFNLFGRTWQVNV
jgi:HAE1 family hydrophobic/amphiphilic exporter-1